MTRQEMKKTAAWAIGSFSLAMALMWQPFVHATDPQQKLEAQIANPKLAADGCEFSIKCFTPEGKLDMKAGDKANFSLVATNNTDKEVKVTVTATLMSSSPAPVRSRMEPMSTPSWSHDQELTLAPHQTTTVALESDYAMPAGRDYVMLRTKEKAVVAANLSVTGPVASGQTLQVIQQKVVQAQAAQTDQQVAQNGDNTQR